MVKHKPKPIIHRCIIKQDRVDYFQSIGVTTLRQLAVLMACNEKEQVTTRKIADMFGFSTSHATAMLNGLKDKGLLIRERKSKVVDPATGASAYWWRRPVELERVMKEYQRPI